MPVRLAFPGAPPREFANSLPADADLEVMAPIDRRGYANARDVLPERLLRQVQRHWHGLLWIPIPKDRSKTRVLSDRDRRIVRAHRRGRPMAELAERFGISRERIRQILRRNRGE